MSNHERLININVCFCFVTRGKLYQPFRMRVPINGNENRILAFNKNIGRYKLVASKCVISLIRKLQFWRQSGFGRLLLQRQVHGLTLPRLPALLFQCPLTVLRHIISFYYQCEILSLIDCGPWEFFRNLSYLSVEGRALIFLVVVS